MWYIPLDGLGQLSCFCSLPGTCAPQHLFWQGTTRSWNFGSVLCVLFALCSSSLQGCSVTIKTLFSTLFSPWVQSIFFYEKISSVPDENRLYLCLDLTQHLAKTLVFPGAGLCLPVSQHTFNFPSELQIHTWSQITEFTRGIKSNIQASQAAGIQTSHVYMLSYLSTPDLMILVITYGLLSLLHVLVLRTFSAYTTVHLCSHFWHLDLRALWLTASSPVADM